MLFIHWPVFIQRVVLLAVLGLCGWPLRADNVSVTLDNARFGLDEVGLYNVGYQLRGGPEVRLPVGWTGSLDTPTGAACQSAGTQNGKAAWLLHCPWKGKTGVTFQEFTVALPNAPQIALRGATALRADAVGKSDGVVCRVFVNGEKRFEANRQDADWLPFEVDLSPHAGQTVRLRFETDPGPRDDSAFDFSLWAERRLETPGFAPTVRTHPAPPPLDLRLLASSASGSVVPASGFPARVNVEATATEVVFHYAGADGTLDYRWSPTDDDQNLLGKLVLHAQQTGDTAVEIPVAVETRLEWTGEAVLKGSRFASLPAKDPAATAATLTRTYAVGGQEVNVAVAGRLSGKSLVLKISVDQPLIRALQGGGWGPVAHRRSLAVPYYSHPILFLSEENVFAGAFLDWTSSQASSHTGTHATYEARTDGTRNLLSETLVYTAAWHLDETLPNIPNPPSPYRAELSRRVMLDLWGGKFADLQSRLQTLVDGGIGPATAIIHDWQFGGYDNKLPQHFPANAALGGDAALAALVQTAERADIRTSLHENYVDYYPNFSGFAEADIARDSKNARVPAWFNESTKIQSFGIRPARILPLAKTQGPEILRRYGGSACYLDVHSAVPPWFHVDCEAGQPGAGQFRPVWDAHRDLWAYERELHNGPVFGEGNNHWYWSGLLDGVEAQFGQGSPDGQGTSAPLLVDFDLLKIHPLQLNHGMGYYERWWAHEPDEKRGLLSLLDQYRMQEVIYGHQGFLAGPGWQDPGFAWLESHLLPPLTTRTALASPMAVEYWLNGGWLDTTAAAKAGADWSQAHVLYGNGLNGYANGNASQPLRVAGEILPPYGWLARGPDFSAGTTLRDGVVTDAVNAVDYVFANARAAADWQERGTTRVRPSVGQFTPTGPRAFRVTYRWAVSQSLPQDCGCFVHFDAASEKPAEKISFQQDHALATPTSRWQPGQTLDDGPWDVAIPAHVAPGDYVWTLGLARDGVGRLPLQGPSDSHQRRILGTLHLAGDGAVTFTAAPSAPTDAGSVNTDNRVVDFGTIRTDGSVCVQRDGADWTLRRYPPDRPFRVELAAARFRPPPGVPIKDGWWQPPATGGSVYRWPAGE